MNKLKRLLLSLTLISTITLPFNLSASTTEEKIAGLYIAFFNRAADQNGLNYWKARTEELGENGALKVLAEGFATHPKFTSLYDGLNNQQYVEEIYINTLGQAGDAEGIAYWKKLLDGGMSRSDMVAEFISVSLDFDSNDSKYDSLRSEGLKSSSKNANALNVAQQRKDLLSNKVAVALKFVSVLKEQTNLEQSTDGMNSEALNMDKTYQASISILSGINHDVATKNVIFTLIDEVSSSDINSIMILNRIREQYGTLEQDVETIQTIKSLLANLALNNAYFETITSELTGRVWMDRNLGASQACDFANDELCFGDYYQWGRYPDGHEKSGSSISLKVQDSYNTNDGKFVINSLDWTTGDSNGTFRGATYNVCPVGFRVPSLDELRAEDFSKNRDLFKLGYAGNRNKNGMIESTSLSAYFLSTTPTALDLYKAAKYANGYESSSILRRTIGVSVRCIQVSEPIAWNVEAWGACSGACEIKHGKQHRSITCQDGNGTVLNDSYCVEKKPDTSQRCEIVSPVSCGTGIEACPIPSQTIVEGAIVPVGADHVSIDKWHFVHNGGDVSFNLLSERGSPWTDIDNDGLQSNLDTYIHLFFDTGNFDRYVAGNDDSSGAAASADGSTHGFDSYMNMLNLTVEGYVLAISDYGFSSNEAAGDSQEDNNIGAYRITFDGDIQLTNIPSNGTVLCNPSNSSFILP